MASGLNLAPGLADSSRTMAAHDPLTTPFRAHLEHCRELGISAQLSECADYIQNIDILVSEFLESYYMVERLWDPESADSSAVGSDEMILEPFYESFEFSLVDPESKRAGESIVCVSGALGPLPSDQHPALSRRGLDFVGLESGESQRIVLGATQSSKTESVFVLLLRALNGLAELSPPLCLAKLGSDVLQKGGIPENAVFSLCLGISEREDEPDAHALLELTRDLAEGFFAKTEGIAQFSGMFSGVTCFEFDEDSFDFGRFEMIWRI